MGRKKKSVLNQNVGEPKEIKTEEIEEILIKEQDGSKPKGTSYSELVVEEVVSEQTEISLKASGEKLAKELEIEILTEKALEEEPPTRTMESLSKAELRWFQRTGMMPK